jgi:hypothetical protein
MRSITLHRYSITNIFLKNTVLSDHGGSIEATRGRGRESHFFGGLISKFLVIFGKSYWVHCTLIQTPGYGAGRIRSNYIGVIIEKINDRTKNITKRKQRKKTEQIWCLNKL